MKTSSSRPGTQWQGCHQSFSTKPGFSHHVSLHVQTGCLHPSVTRLTVCIENGIPISICLSAAPDRWLHGVFWRHKEMHLHSRTHTKSALFYQFHPRLGDLFEISLWEVGCSASQWEGHSQFKMWMLTTTFLWGAHAHEKLSFQYPTGMLRCEESRLHMWQKGGPKNFFCQVFQLHPRNQNASRLTENKCRIILVWTLWGRERSHIPHKHVQWFCVRLPCAISFWSHIIHADGYAHTAYSISSTTTHSFGPKSTCILLFWAWLFSYIMCSDQTWDTTSIYTHPPRIYKDNSRPSKEILVLKWRWLIPVTTQWATSEFSVTHRQKADHPNPLPNIQHAALVNFTVHTTFLSSGIKNPLSFVHCNTVFQQPLAYQSKHRFQLPAKSRCTIWIAKSLNFFRVLLPARGRPSDWSQNRIFKTQFSS